MIQLPFLILLHLISAIWLIFKSPFESKVDKIVNGLNELSTLFTMIFTMIMVIDNKHPYITESRKI